VAESIRCKLEVVAAPTFSIYAPAHTLAGVVGDNIVFKVNMTAIGAWETYYTPYTYPHPHRSDAILGD
jgi:hypothetical protein